jgi:hypothetical protein
MFDKKFWAVLLYGCNKKLIHKRISGGGVGLGKGARQHT